MIRLRDAHIDDVPWLLEQLEDFSKFFGSKHSLFPSKAYGTEKLKELIEGHIMCVAHSDINEQPCVGFIGGILAPHFFNPEVTVLTELFWWVTPDWRNTRTGLMLLEEFIRIGNQKAKWIIMTLEDTSPVRPESLLKRGFRAKEHNYLLEV